jgi:levansucrase
VSGSPPALWTRQHLERLVETTSTTAPVVRPWASPRTLPHEDVWDIWPVHEADGSLCEVFGRVLWMALSAPALGHPDGRHDVARLRLLASGGKGWHDLGPAFGEGVSPGSREWSGSAVRRPDGSVSVYYTAAGLRGEARPTFVQRVIESRSNLVTDGGHVRLDGCDGHREVVRPDRRWYLPADEIDGAPGRIRAFRDPGWFRDPADGCEYLVIAASVPWRDRFMGAIALAVKRPGGWSLLPPLLQADGIHHEIERPHIVVRESRYYLFFSAQRHSFHPPDCAPTGLYGFVAPNLTGPYEPLNGSGLVIQNSSAEPDQAYAWLVLGDLRAVSFLNYRSPNASDPRQPQATEARARFGGTIAPVLQLALDRTTTSIVGHQPSDRRIEGALTGVSSAGGIAGTC